MNTQTAQRPAQDEAIQLIQREINDIDADLTHHQELLTQTASVIGKLETRKRRMCRLFVMAGGEA